MSSRDEEFETMLAAEAAGRNQSEEATAKRQLAGLEIASRVEAELSEFGSWAVNKFQTEGVSPTDRIPRPGFVYRTFPIPISRGLLGISGWDLGKIKGLDLSPAFLKADGTIIRGDPKALMEGEIEYAANPSIRQDGFSEGLYLDGGGKLRVHWTEGNMAGNEERDADLNSLMMSSVVRIISTNR